MVVRSIPLSSVATFVKESFAENKEMASDISQKVTEEGVQIMEELLAAWSSSTQDGEDTIMADDLSPEAQLEELKKCVAEFQPRIQSNEWLRSVITAL